MKQDSIAFPLDDDVKSNTMHMMANCDSHGLLILTSSTTHLTWQLGNCVTPIALN